MMIMMMMLMVMVMLMMMMMMMMLIMMMMTMMLTMITKTGISLEETLRRSLHDFLDRVHISKTSQTYDSIN